MAPEAGLAPGQARGKWLREKRAEAVLTGSSHKATSRATSSRSAPARGPPPTSPPRLHRSPRATCRAPDQRGELRRCGPTARAPPSAFGATAARRARRSAPRRARRRSTARRGPRANHRARRRQEVEVRERRPARGRAPVRAPEHGPAVAFLGSQRRDAVAESSGVGFGIQRHGAGQARGERVGGVRPVGEHARAAARPVTRAPPPATAGAAARDLKRRTRAGPRF